MTETQPNPRSEFWPGLDSLLPDCKSGSWRAPGIPQGIPEAAHSLALALCAQRLPRPLLVVAPDDDRAHQLCQEILTLLGSGNDWPNRILYLPKPDARPYERIPWTGQTRQGRLTALSALLGCGGRGCLVTCSVEALMQVTLPPGDLSNSLHTYRVGDSHPVTATARRWVDAGYTKVNMVDGAGTFAQRGSILDIWPANLLAPVRLDFFGDEIETIRAFDPQSQRSTEQLDTVVVGPASEALARYGDELLERVGLPDGTVNAAALMDVPPSERGPLQDPSLSLFVQEEIAAEVRKLAELETFDGIEWYLPYLYAEPACLLDYLDPGGLLVLDDGAACEQAVAALEREQAELRSELLHSGDVPAGFDSSRFSYDDMLERLEAQRPLLLGYGDLQGVRDSAVQGVGRCCRALDLQQDPQAARPQTIRTLAEEDAAVLIVSQMGGKVQDMLEAADLMAEPVARLDREPVPGLVRIMEGSLQGGFSLHRPDRDVPMLLVVTDTELFDVQKVYRRRHQVRHQGYTPERFFAEVDPGDPVVHVDFGIGSYAGLSSRTVRSVHQEYIQVEYQAGDKVLVPVHQADRVSRYVGPEDPVLSRLGSSRWTTARDKVRKEVQEIAEELLAVYAHRETATGRAAGPDESMQVALEMAFPFDETPDQLQAVVDVKADLESERHMDRLIVGDVGFGKTEVALRGAFKTVMDSRQVAVLVPTTVLAHQHHATFTDRMCDMPVRIEVLSRLRSPAERRRVKTELAAGTVDIVVGTHALLAKDVKFRDLGLLIIDEEQRFGVRQKEKIKQLRPTVNVLTMSATPIPRTMNMGLSGIRDISYITSPPEERLPVHTIMAPYDSTLVRRALERELKRDGQAFVVTDRIRGLTELADEIARLLPGAVIDMAHGSMKGDELEDAMLHFSRGETDVLVCTTIIENGLDIPNANTMIVNYADRFGMAQLYQLRGRVGRSHRRGHCYLLFAEREDLNFNAATRLRHIVESSNELGAGFRIAMSDLQLRGAGEILGARQSGSMGTIGLDLYSRLLANAVENLRITGSTDPEAATGASQNGAEPSVKDPLADPVTLLLPLAAHIPDWYIEDGATRYQLYHRVAGLASVEAENEFRRELIDRFGSVSQRVDAVPEEIENLLYQIRLKRAAEEADIESISTRDPEILIKPRTGFEDARHRIQSMLNRVIHADLTMADLTHRPWRVGREGIYVSLSNREGWQDTLLEIVVQLGVFRAEARALVQRLVAAA